MAKYSDEFKKFIVEERLIYKKGYQQIEREHGVLRGTVYPWVQKFKNGTLFIDFRHNNKSENKKEQEYEFLKKSFALLKKIRSKQKE